jgi:hypothetical protein
MTLGGSDGRSEEQRRTLTSWQSQGGETIILTSGGEDGVDRRLTATRKNHLSRQNLKKRFWET